MATRELRKRPSSVVYGPAKRPRLSSSSSTLIVSPRRPELSHVTSAPVLAQVAPLASPSKAKPVKKVTPQNNEGLERTNAFLKENAAVFLPLLPKSNSVVSLKDATCGKTVPYHELAEQPTLVKAQMKDYQVTGLSFLVWLHNNGASGILGDEMGLGKTLQTLSLFAYLHERNLATGTQLVICPLSVISSWLNEAAKWVPHLRTARLHGSANERSAFLMNELGVGANKNKKRPDIVVATYEAYKAEHKRLKALGKFQYLVLDEGHKIKNPDSDISMALQGLSAQHRLLLTGTPLQNNLAELYALLHWLYPNVFTPTSQQRFTDAFDLTRGKYDRDFMASCERILQLIMIRRTKEGLKHQLDDIPPREEHILYVPLSPLQRFWYSRLLTHLDDATFTNVFGKKEQTPKGKGRKGKSPAKIEKNADDDDDEDIRILQSTVDRTVSETKSGSSQWRLLLNLLMQLRKVCNHPYIMHDGAPDPYYLGEHLVMASSKFVLVDKLLKKILTTDEQTLCFSGFTGMLDMMEDLLRLREIPYARLDGNTSRARRALDIQLFNAKPSPYKVFLLSTRAGGLGVNLASATNVIMLDCDWNPQVTLQAIARAHRIGQKSVVKVYTIVTENSVESQMLSRLRKKAYLAAKVLGSSNQNMQNTAVKSALPASPLPLSSGQSTPVPVAALSTPIDGGEVPEEPTSLGLGDLVSILKSGSAALASPWENEASPSEAFAKSSFDEIMARSKRRENIDTVKIQAETADPNQLPTEVAEDEEEVLRGAEQVKTRLWQGRIHSADRSQSNFAIRQSWEKMEKRIRRERVVTIDGHSVSVDSIGKDGAFCAVPTITADADNLAKLQVPKRKRREYDHQDHCFTCDNFYEGTLIPCRGCPRSYHDRQECCGISKTEMAKKGRAIGQAWMCAQHSCMSCYKKSAEAGGLIIRCRTCPASYCYDCLDKESGWVPVGDSLDEFEILGFPANSQAYFIHCRDCIQYHTDYPAEAKRWKSFFKAAKIQLAKMKESEMQD